MAKMTTFEGVTTPFFQGSPAATFGLEPPLGRAFGPPTDSQTTSPGSQTAFPDSQTTARQCSQGWKIQLFPMGAWRPNATVKCLEVSAPGTKTPFPPLLRRRRRHGG